MSRLNMCLLGLHKYEVFETKLLTNRAGNEIGTIYVSKCSCCGKLNFNRVYTIE